jgi:phosphate starvation-inducible PhoH-like protein
MVVTGDITQIDLPLGQNSGLIEVQHILGKVKGIEFIGFTPKDVVRHHLVQHIIEAYQENDKGRNRHIPPPGDKNAPKLF